MDALKRLKSIKTVDGPGLLQTTQKISTAEKIPAVDALTRLKNIKTVDEPKEKYYTPNFEKWEAQESIAKAYSQGALYNTPKYQSGIIKATKGNAEGLDKLIKINDKAVTDGVTSALPKIARWQSTVRDTDTIAFDKKQSEIKIRQYEDEKSRLQQNIKNIEARENTSGRFPLSSDEAAKLSADKAKYQKSIFDIDKRIENEKNSISLADEESAWSRYFNYYNLMANPDFSAKSGYKSTANGETAKTSGAGRRKRSVYTSLGYDDPVYEYINGNPTAIDYNKTNQSVISNYSHLSEMTDDEIKIFNYIYATEGKEKAHEYVDFLEKTISKTGNTTLRGRYRETLETEAAEFAKEHPGLASVKTVVTSPLKAVTPIMQIADVIKNGEVTPDASYNRLNYENTAIRQAVAENINNDVGKFFYNTGMSIGDFATTLAVSVGNPTASLAIMGSGAAGDAVIEARDRGLNSAQALALGILSGAAEVVMEKIGLDALFDGSWSKNGIRYVLKNALAESGEEAGTNLINTFADILISGDKSHWQNAINNYMAQGMTESQAWINAFKDKSLEIGTDALSGLVSGIATSGTLSAPQIASDFNKAQSEWRSNNEYLDELEARANASGKSMAELFLEDYENGTKVDTSAVAVYTYKSSEGGNDNGKIQTADRSGAYSLSGGDRYTPRGDTSHTENVHNGEAARNDEGVSKRWNGRRTDSEESHRYSLVRPLESEHLPQGEDRTAAQGGRFLEALNNNENDVARKLLNEQAKANGYEPTYLYHGTYKGEPFDAFKNDNAIWVTGDKRYAKDYAIPYTKATNMLSNLFSDDNLSIFELYAKKGKTLDLGNVDKEIEDLNDFKAFADKIGFSIPEILKCWEARENTEIHSIWAMTNTKEFADIARAHGYDSLLAIENGDVETFGILYPNNLKSSKLRTYDNTGAIIPLDKRFDDSRKSIRYSLSSETRNTAEKLAEDNSSPYTMKYVEGPVTAENYTPDAQHFTADTSKYTSERARRTVEKAINSGVLNNSEATHRMVDMVAKISNDKGIEFVFVNNAMLEKMGFKVNGRQVNGVYTANGIYLNVDSPVLTEHVIGHEITHVLEGTKFYDELQRAITKYAQMKGGYTARIGEVQSLYDGVENSNIYNEVTAELVGEYLFTDEGFVNNLAVTNKNLFQRIWDEIKYISKLLTAGSPEARQLERVKHTFEKAYNSSNVKNIGEGEVRYSIVENFEDTNGIHYDSAVLLDTDFFEGLSPRNWGQKLKGYVESRSVNDPFIMPIVDENGVTQQLQFATPSERVTKDGKSNHKVIDELWNTDDNISKLSVVHIDEIMEISEESNPYYTSNNQHQWLDANGWLHRNAYVINNKNGAIYNITIDISKTKDGRTILYATSGKIKRVGNVQVNSLVKRGSGQNSNSSITITSPDGNVNNNFSLSMQNHTSTGTQGTPLNSLRYNPSDSSVSSGDSISVETQSGDERQLNPSWLSELGKKETVAVEPQGRISANMSELERYEILKNKNLVNVPVVSNIPQRVIEAVKNNPNFQNVSSWGGISDYFGKEKRTLIQKIASEFGVFKDYKNTDIGISFEFSNNNFRESYSKQGKNYENFAKMFSVFDQVVQNAVGIEVHNRNNKGYKTDVTLNNVYVLVSAFEEGDLIYPVKLEIKEFSDKPNTLYVAIALEAIKKTEVSKQGTTENSVAQNSRSVTISIQDILKNVNVKDINFLKYVPNGFLTTEQIRAKEKYLSNNSVFHSSSETVLSKSVATVKDKNERILNELTAQLETLGYERQDKVAEYDNRISSLFASLTAESPGSARYGELTAQITDLLKIKEDILQNIDSKIEAVQAQIEKKNSPDFKRAEQRTFKRDEYTKWAEDLIGDTSTWVDKKSGKQYSRNTLRRNLRDIVRKPDGSPDIERADRIWYEIQGKYNEHEAEMNRELSRIRQAYADMKITRAEDAYIQMLGEFRHNPDTTLTQEQVEAFYQKHKNSIDTAKVDKIIDMARETYDTLYKRVNEVLREQGMKELPYREGYFPHFTEEKQGWFARLFNWKIKSNDIPTDIAGLTETFNPKKSYQTFDKERRSDETDYSFMKGLDAYSFGALDWIYHIEDLQKRRAIENAIRYEHSDQAVKEKIDAIRAENYDEETEQLLIDKVIDVKDNPLNHFIIDFRSQTNTLAGKKPTADRTEEYRTNRKMYSVMDNVSRRVSGNMVGGNIRSALTNLIAITQSWGEVSLGSSLKAAKDIISSGFRDDGITKKSSFLTNRLAQADSLYKTWWDKVSDIASVPMEAVDWFSSEVIWRSKYYDNIKSGMTEADAIKNADEFSASVMASRSRGEMPTIFEEKNWKTRLFTAFQLEVNNQYGYMFKDMPQNMRNERIGKLVGGYVKMFLGAYLFNLLFKALTGDDAAFDPIGIAVDTVIDIKEHDENTVANLIDNVIEEIPFYGSYFGGGRMPLESALPYGSVPELIEGVTEDVSNFGNGGLKNMAKELINPATYLLLPTGGGQIAKTVKGGIALAKGGSYKTDSKGEEKLQYPYYSDEGARSVGNAAKALIFGKNSLPTAQDWVDSGFKTYTADETAAYNEMKNAGAGQRESIELIDKMKTIEKTSDKRDTLKKSNIPDAAKFSLYYHTLASKNEKEPENDERTVLDKISDKSSVNVILDMKNADKKYEKAAALRDTSLSIHDKAVLFEAYVEGDTEQYNGEITRGIFGKFEDEGFAEHISVNYALAVSSLKPLEGKKSVSLAQKWEAITDVGYPAPTTLAAMKALITGDKDTKESQIFKLDLCYENNIPLDAYAQLKVHMGEYDENGNGTYSAKDYQKAIDELFPTYYGAAPLSGKTDRLTVSQKSALWQILTGNTSTDNNPYGTVSSAAIANAYKSRRSESSAKTNTVYPGQAKNYPGQAKNYPGQ